MKNLLIIFIGFSSLVLSQEKLYKLVFVSDRNGPDDIYTINSDGTDLKQLTKNSTSNYSPSWSPDGKQIVFNSHRNGGWKIWIIDEDGGNPRRTSNGNDYEYHPQWSPDGKFIAFELWNFSSRNFEIALIDLKTKNVTNLTNHNSHDRIPSWKSDGSKIAFYSNRDGDDEIYVMDSNGKNLEQITNNSATDYAPSWIPNSNKIIYHSNESGEFKTYLYNLDSKQKEIFKVIPPEMHKQNWNAKGSSTGSTPYESLRNGSPIFTSDGKKIFFTIFDKHKNKYDIISMNPNGSSIKKIISSNGDDWFPSPKPVLK